MKGTIDEQGIAVFSGEQQIYAGTIYAEGGYVYGNLAVQIGGTKYHFDKEPEPGEPKQLPDPWRVEFDFAEELAARTGNQAGSDPKKAQFWVGTLDYNSAAPSDKPYTIEMTLYAGMEPRKHTVVSFLVADTPGPGEGGGGGEKPKPPDRP
jgi:hypothetical protein